MSTATPKKVLIFSMAYYPHLIGGAEVAVKEITDRMGSDEIEFDMVTLYVGKQRVERIGNVTLYRVGAKVNMRDGVPHISRLIQFQYIFFALSRALLLHSKRKYDLTWAIMASFGGFSALFFKYIHPRIPFLLTLQEGDPIAHIKKSVGVMYPVFVRIFRKADYIQTISTFLAQFAKDMGARCPVMVVPNAVDFAHFSNKPPQGQVRVLLQELGINPFDTTLITTGRLVPKNGVEDIIDALTYLPLEVKLIVVGTGFLEKMLKEKTAVLKLEKRVRFVGFVPHKEIPLYLHASNIFVRPSLSEGFGNSFIEAMAADLPVIATPVGGIPDFLQDGETGLFCEPHNPRSIAQKIEKLMKDIESREFIKKTARTMVMKKYDWNLISRSMRDVFSNAINLASH